MKLIYFAKVIFLSSIIIHFNAQSQAVKSGVVPPIVLPEKIQSQEEPSENLPNKETVNVSGTENELEKQMDFLINNQINELTGQKEEKKHQKTEDNIRKIEDKKSTQLILDAKKPSSLKDLWKFFTIIVGCGAFLGFALIMINKFKRKGAFGLSRSEKIMDVVSSMSLSPKRQIIIIKIRDQEIVVSSTENGINFLTEINGLNYSSKGVIEKKPNLISDKVAFSRTDRSITELLEDKTEQKKKDSLEEKKSDILLKALKSLNSNMTPSKKRDQDHKDNEKKSASSASFPKYLANNFEVESKKEVRKKEEDMDSVENVTNLIREKLRSMKPLN